LLLVNCLIDTTMSLRWLETLSSGFVDASI